MTKPLALRGILASAVDRGHKGGVSTRRCRVDACDTFRREACDIVRPAGLGARTAETFTAERLALDDGADLVPVDVEIADTRMLLDIVAHGVDTALEAEGQAIACGV